MSLSCVLGWVGIKTCFSMNAIQVTQALKVLSTSSIIIIIDQKYTNGIESGGCLLT